MNLVNMEVPSPIEVESPVSCDIRQKITLSKNSKEFRMPKHVSPVGKRHFGELDSHRDQLVKSGIRDANDSEFSTEESDNDLESAGLSLTSTAFYAKRNSNGSTQSGNQIDGYNTILANLENQQLENNCETLPKSTFQRKPRHFKDTKNPKSNRGEECQEATIKKPRKKFTNRNDKDKFVESYKMKKKTELCKNWELSRRCKFGSDCAFAHGEQELVSKHHVPNNYKTKMCKQFHEEGYCPYGNRWQFLHLIIQKDVKKFNYWDIMSENLYQYQTRSKVISTESLEGLMINPLKSKRLSIFEEICPEKHQSRRKSDKQLDGSVWDSFEYSSEGVKA